MRERPILFSGPMVRAILEGRKTQTRRVVKPHRSWAVHSVCYPSGAADPWAVWFHYPDHPRVGHLVECPQGKPGDHLWVRESGWEPRVPTEREFRDGADTWRYAYDADGLSESDVEDFKAWGWKRRPSIFMPRLASRITLEIADVRVQRVQEISEEDAKAEGVEPYRPTEGNGGATEGPAWYRIGFSHLWDSVRSGERLKRGEGWDANPWVWAITFRRIS